MEPLPHVDVWTQADEQAFMLLPDVQKFRHRAIDELEEWSETQTDPTKAYRWGQKYGPNDRNYKPYPGSPAERVEEVRDQVRKVDSRIIPFQEPLLFSLNSRLLKRVLQLPAGAPTVGQNDRLCLLIYGFDLRPAETEKIVSVDLRLTYIRPKALTYNMFPNTELEERFRAKTSVNLGIAAKGSVGVPDVAVHPFVEVGASAHAEVESGLIFHWQYQVLKANVINYGTQSDFAEWSISKQGLVGPLELRVLIRIPKEARRMLLEVTGNYKVTKRAWGWQRERIAEITPTQAKGQITANPPTPTKSTLPS